MGRIHLSYVKAGMVLSSDVRNFNSMVLLPAETKITEKALSTLKAWGITEIEIKDLDQSKIMAHGATEIDPKLLSDATRELESHFCHSGRVHPALQHLFELCVTRKARSQEEKRA